MQEWRVRARRCSTGERGADAPVTAVVSGCSDGEPFVQRRRFDDLEHAVVASRVELVLELDGACVCVCVCVCSRVVWVNGRRWWCVLPCKSMLD
jgi:hypothetical protein